MTEKVIQVGRPFEMDLAAQIVQVASRFKSHISLVTGDKTANAKSIMGIISLALNDDSIVKIIANGEDGQQAIPELENILLAKR